MKDVMVTPQWREQVASNSIMWNIRVSEPGRSEGLTLELLCGARSANSIKHPLCPCADRRRGVHTCRGRRRKTHDGMCNAVLSCYCCLG